MRKYCMYALVILAWGCGVTPNFHNNVVIAHRGAWKQAQAPENSIQALEQAITLGCHGSEFDVHLTKDDSLVVNHDKDFYGMDIATSTYAQLLETKLPNGEKIPTVSEYLQAGLKQKKTKLILEIKSSGAGQARTLRLTELAVKQVERMRAKKWVEYICFDYEAGKYVHQLDPKAKVAYLNGDIDPEQAKKDGYTGIDYNHKVYLAHPDWISKAREIGLTVNVWTVNREEEMKAFLEEEVDYITTNEPELLLNITNAE